MNSPSTVIQNICCIGAGYVGGPTMAVIADRCPHLQVNVVDLNEKRISAWNSPDLSKLPVYEPGLESVVRRSRGRNLYFSTNVDDAISCADMIFISVNTPTKSKGLGSGQASDLRWVEACARQVAENAKGHTIVVEKSTLPVRTAETIQAILSAAQNPSSINEPPKSFVVLSNPEFLAEGTAIQDLEAPDRILIGGEDPNAIESLASIYQNWVPKNKILRTNLWSSELSKLTANAFLAQRISSINSIGALCEVTGADIREVAMAIGADSRIGIKFLNSGPGFGGSCFKKDILNLVYLANYFNLPEVADYWEHVVRLNTWQQHRIARLIVRRLFGTVTGKRLALFGFTFKADTNDTREAPSINIAKDLLEEGAQLAIYDPKAKTIQIEADLGLSASNHPKDSGTTSKKGMTGEGIWWPTKTVTEAVQGVDAIVILTEWNEFKKIDWSTLARYMRKPAWVFDARGVVNTSQIKQAGLKLWRVGDGAL